MDPNVWVCFKSLFLPSKGHIQEANLSSLTLEVMVERAEMDKIVRGQREEAKRRILETLATKEQLKRCI